MNALLFEPDESVRVRETPELLRVRDLPRRTWDEKDARELAREMTAILRTPYGEMQLRPLQAVALYELGTEGGLCAPLRVGQGKTLISLLAPTVTFAERPLLVVPASLVAKTKRDWQVLQVHWKISPLIQIMTYEWLGRPQASPLDDRDALQRYSPDLVVFDEVHKVRNKKAAVTRRVRRFFAQAHRDALKGLRKRVKCAVMSGTIMKRSIHDFAHMLHWTHEPDKLPIPRDFESLDLWADALDERKNQSKVAHPGALQVLCDERELALWQEDPREAARSAFRRRFVETAGVVASYETEVDATLTVQTAESAGVDVLDQYFKVLRGWQTPDGWPIDDALRMSQHAHELALGLYYVWDPRPPSHWLQARRAWSAFVRQVLKHSRTLDSASQVALAHPDAPEYLLWKQVEDDFVPQTRAEWVSDAVLKHCAEWGERERGIVWTKHVEFALELSRLTGWTYYGRRGYDADGNFIDDHAVGAPMIASIDSNAQGRNLQAWQRALVTAPPANGQKWEQLLGRLHREGQQADEVSFTVLLNCIEHAEAVWQAVADSRVVEQATGSPQKLLLAGLDVPAPETLVFRPGDRWQK